MKFLVDMPFSPKTAKYLRLLGHDAIHAFSIANGKALNSELFQLAREQDRIILSMDLDFGYIATNVKLPIPGVIIFRVKHATVEKVNSYLKQLLDRFSEKEIENSVLVVEETRIRRRKLPI
jgi:predicted nuclease of predicted toxin-antitoxin system